MRLDIFTFDGGHHDPVIMVIESDLEKARKLATEKIGEGRGLKHIITHYIDKPLVVYHNEGEC